MQPRQEAQVPRRVWVDRLSNSGRVGWSWVDTQAYNTVRNRFTGFRARLKT